MEKRGVCIKINIVKLACLYGLVAVLFTYSDARTMLLSKDASILKTRSMKHLKILDMAKSMNMLMDVSVKDSSNAQLYVGSPLTLTPYDSLAPLPLPDTNSPPYCVYPPPNPSIVPGPIVYSPTPTLSPPPSPLDNFPGPPEVTPSSPPSPLDNLPSPPIIFPGPPESTPTPSPFTPIINPPNYEPSPPSGVIPTPGPPDYVPSPIGFAPSPPVFEPPVVYPPSVVPPPSTTGGSHGSGLWCVAKPSVPDPIIQEAMNYACGSGADCDPIQPNGQCFAPNTLLAHASYAFNSYWQRTKVAGGTCSFGGTAILVTVDPSSQGCRFE